MDGDVRRLGKRELGRHAFEERMLERIASLIAAEGDGNSLSGVIPKLAQLLEHDSNVQVAYLCGQAAVQVYKLPDEGAHFCGYRNIQMLCLALGSASNKVLPLLDELKGKLTITRLQDMIEHAWDRGFNAHGKVQTGGIKGTRKHIGSSEIEALLLSLNVPCTGHAFTGSMAWSELLDSVEAYYAASSPAKQGVHVTTAPPIFLQRPKHSITIVGFERTVSGQRRLLVFDPAWRPPATMMKASLSKSEVSGWSAKWTLKRYRKSERYLKKWKGFETVSIDVKGRAGG